MPKASSKAKLKVVKKSEPKAARKPTSKTEIFKGRKNRDGETAGKPSDVIKPPEDIREAIDAFRDAQAQMKHFEGESTVQKDILNDYSLKEFSKRAMAGKAKSFRLESDENQVMYVVMDTSSGITEDEVQAFVDQWGDDAAEELIKRDFGSIRFDPDVLETNYEAVVEALQVLPKDVLENLFKSGLCKAVPGAVEKAKKYAKNAEQLRELLQQLKMRNYIR